MCVLLLICIKPWSRYHVCIHVLFKCALVYLSESEHLDDIYYYCNDNMVKDDGQMLLIYPFYDDERKRFIEIYNLIQIIFYPYLEKLRFVMNCEGENIFYLVQYVRKCFKKWKTSNF